jgi:hypothetical protein
VQAPGLNENRSSPREQVALVNQLRDAANQTFRGSFLLRTTDATPAVIWQDDMPADSVWDVSLTVLALAGDDADFAAGFRRVFRVKRIPGGAAHLMATATPVPDVDDLGTLVVTVSTMGTGPRVTVMGDAIALGWVALVEVAELAG